MTSSVLWYLVGTITRAAILFLLYRAIVAMASSRITAETQKRLVLAAITLLFVPIHCFTVALPSRAQMTADSVISPPMATTLTTLAPPVPALAESEVSFSWQMLLLTLLTAVGIVKGILFLYHYFRLRRELARMTELPDGRMRRLSIEVFSRSGIAANKVTCRDAGNFFSSPASCYCGGLQLLLPVESLQRRNDQEIRMLILHECSHIKRHDLLTAHCLSLLAALMWFNPFLHLLIREMERTAELTADADAIRWFGADTRSVTSYAKLMVELAAAPVADPVIRGMSFGYFADLKARIIALSATHKTSRILFCSLMATLCASAVILPNIAAKEVGEQSGEKGLNEPIPPSVKSDFPAVISENQMRIDAPQPRDVPTTPEPVDTSVSVTVETAVSEQIATPIHENGQSAILETSTAVETPGILENTADDIIAATTIPVATEYAELQTIATPPQNDDLSETISIDNTPSPVIESTQQATIQPLAPSETKVFFAGGSLEDTKSAGTPSNLSSPKQNNTFAGKVIEAPFQLLSKTVKLSGKGMTISGIAAHGICAPTVVLAPVGTVVLFTGKMAEKGMDTLGEGISFGGEILTAPMELLD